MMVHTCNPSTVEAEAEGSQVRSQPGLHTVTLSQQNKIVLEYFGTHFYKKKLKER
jgi:hypothetical protein